MKLHSLLAFAALLASCAAEGASEEKGKDGDCPFVVPAMCFVYEAPQCNSDRHCPDKQKCCRAMCGIKCLDPVDPAKPVKVNPGKCPVVTGQCRMLGRRDYCQNDSHCMADFEKCCTGPCGKSCVRAVRDFNSAGP